ncbi:hypothetical protein [Ferruginivarius sediminum]|uniref:Uncharacterized protein n=1 Tax=Ferruginivarius sediminum TaxID=2661937 RepID=A0A369THQ7_9PROT|nr:hypothetical protein [Ferruginivarius sediminum]RDD63925.1 hypothetical protein DRB17_01875 [Ferruginivarius sediminum]
MLAERLDIFGRRYRRQPVAAGAVYRRLGADNTVETARVLSIGEDIQGIPHVRFRVSIRRAEIAYVDEERILSQECFAERYRERVDG